MKVRLHGRLSSAIAMPDSARQVRLPPMVLLPLIDYAVRGSRSVIPIDRSLRIDATVADGRLRVAIEDAGDAFASDVQESAMAQVRAHLGALYGSQATLFCRRSELSGIQAIVEIPHEHAESDHR